MVIVLSVVSLKDLLVEGSRKVVVLIRVFLIIGSLLRSMIFLLSLSFLVCLVIFV